MVGSRDRNGYRTDAPQERVKIGKPTDSHCRLDFTSTRPGNVVEPDQLDLIQPGEMPGMVQAERADSDNPDR
jgi:hypothetical protein